MCRTIRLKSRWHNTEFLSILTSLSVSNLHAQDETLEAKMTRDEFESLIGDLLQRIRIPVLRALEKVHGECQRIFLS